MAKSKTAFRTLTHTNGMDAMLLSQGHKIGKVSYTKSPSSSSPNTMRKVQAFNPPSSPTKDRNQRRKAIASQQSYLLKYTKTSSVQAISPNPELPLANALALRSPKVSTNTEPPHGNALTLRSPAKSLSTRPHPCFTLNDPKSSTTVHTTSLGALTEFYFFEKLPIELRLRIWGMAGRTPSIIGIKDVERKIAFSGTSIRCSLLLTCKESRKEVLRIKIDVNRTFSGTSDLAATSFLAAKSSLPAVQDLSLGPKLPATLDTPAAPKLYANLETDILWLTIDFPHIHNYNAILLKSKLLNGPLRNICKLAIPYSLFRRHPEDFCSIVVKLDLEELILVIKSEEIAKDDTAAIIQPRSKACRVSRDWAEWEDLTRSEARCVHDAVWQAQYKYQRGIKKGETPAALMARGRRDLSNFKEPKVTIRDIVNSKNVLPEELVALANEEDYEDFEAEKYGSGTDSE